MVTVPATVTKWDQLATLIRYPGDGSAPAITSALEWLSAHDNEIAITLAPFARFIHESAETDLEEFYTRTFDINPLCCLEVGWQVHGDTYERGAYLVKARGLLRDHGLSEGTELPDHLATILPLVPLLDEVESREMRDVFMLPAVIRMRRGFVSGAGEGNIFDAVLAAIEIVLRRETSLTPEILTALERGTQDKPSSAAGEHEFGPNGTPLPKEAPRGR